MSTTHLTVADRFGNVVAYFNFETGTANSPAGGKRQRSSLSPTIVFDHGQPAVALGSPGGSTIITTVLQILVNHIDFHQTLSEALAAPKAASRNTSSIQYEPGFEDDKNVLRSR